MNEKVIRHKAICDGLNELYARKNHDYGDSFHKTFLEEGMAMPRIRLEDKLSRFKTLSRISPTDSAQQQVADESIRDTLLDLANYAIMTVLELDDAMAQPNVTTYSLHNSESPIIKEGYKAAIYSLYDAGAPIITIAGRLGLTADEVLAIITSANSEDGEHNG